MSSVQSMQNAQSVKKSEKSKKLEESFNSSDLKDSKIRFFNEQSKFLIFRPIMFHMLKLVKFLSVL